MFEQRILFYKLFSSFKIMGATYYRNIYKILNLNISASWQNIKKLDGNFGAIHVGNVHANFQASSFTGEAGE